MVSYYDINAERLHRFGGFRSQESIHGDQFGRKTVTLSGELLPDIATSLVLSWLVCLGCAGSCACKFTTLLSKDESVHCVWLTVCYDLASSCVTKLHVCNERSNASYWYLHPTMLASFLEISFMSYNS